MARGAEIGRAQLGAGDAGRCSVEDADQPDAGEDGRGSEVDAARPDVEEETGGAAMECPAGQAVEDDPAPELSGARDEEVAATAAQMAPAEEALEAEVPERVEGLGEVASNTAFGEVGWSADLATASEGGLGAGTSQLPGEGVSWAIVQPGVSEKFVHAEREEDEVWQAQLDLGGEIDASI